MKKHPESHMDHGFTSAQWDYIFTKYADKKAFFIDTFELPEGLGTVTNELYGPSVGDAPVAEVDVFYDRRGDRAWDSRLVRWPKRPTRFVRVIAGPHEETCPTCNGTGFWGSGVLDAPFPTPGGICCAVHHGTQCTDGKLKHACILYTAYGVSSIDVAASPKEPGDLEAQLAALRKANDTSQEGLEKLARCEAQLSEARIFWRTHALAASRIKSARITDMPKKFGDPMPKVYVTMEDGKEQFLFEYYPDELHFAPNEFVGLTLQDAHKLKHTKDVAYLRS